MDLGDHLCHLPPRFPGEKTNQGGFPPPGEGNPETGSEALPAAYSGLYLAYPAHALR